jgi:predicted xylose isomerase-like sugar epimerase
MSKLTSADVREIIRIAGYDAAVGYQIGSVKALAARFGVTTSTIRAIARGDRWKRAQRQPTSTRHAGRREGLVRTYPLSE